MANAPIILFAYNRPKHIARAIRSLQANPEFEDSPITVFCDGPKNDDHLEAVEQTRAAVKNAGLPAHAKIVERDKNMGLANSIIAGITEATDAHGKVIIVEDDLVLSKAALGFLNAGLDRYENDEQVMHISAYMYPVPGELDESFFLGEGTCWGWATWKDSWKHFNPDAKALMKTIDDKKIRSGFDIDDTMFFYAMLKKQCEGDLDSWAIRWYASMYLNNGLSLHPRQSYVENLGFDGSGIHCNVDDRFIGATTSKATQFWPDKFERNAAALEAMKEYRRTTFFSKKRRLFEQVKQAFRSLRY